MNNPDLYDSDFQRQGRKGSAKSAKGKPSLRSLR